MRKIIVASFVLSLACLSWAAGPSIAVIDLEELVRLHPNTAADKKLLEQTLKEYSAQKDQLQAQVESTRAAFTSAAKEAQNPALNEKAKSKLEEEALAKRNAALEAERAYTDTVRSLQRQLTEEEVRMLRRTTSEIEAEVAAYAKAAGLQLVLQLPGRKMNVASGVVFAAPPLDITAAIMKQMGIKPEAASDTNATPAAAAPAAPGRR